LYPQRRVEQAENTISDVLGFNQLSGFGLVSGSETEAFAKLLVEVVLAS
jgi:hypothetical protein